MSSLWIDQTNQSNQLSLESTDNDKKVKWTYEHCTDSNYENLNRTTKIQYTRLNDKYNINIKKVV